jgi:replicative DNA helicase
MTAYPARHPVDKPPDGLLDPAAVREHLTRLHEGRPFEVRAVRRRKGRVYAGYFDNVEAAARAVAAKVRGDAKGWYTTLNPVTPELLGRVYNRLEDFPAATTADHDVTGYRHLLIDPDAVRPAETSSTDAQLAAALGVRDAVAAYLADILGWPAPLYSSMSGNGGSLVYRLALLPNDQETVALIKGCLEALGEAFGTAAVKIDQTVSNPARITKLMGTPVRKGDDTPRQPHRMAVAEYSAAAGEVTREQLRALAATSISAAPATPQRSTENGPGRTWRLGDVLQRSGVGYSVKAKPYGTVYALDRCLTSDAHADGAAVLEFADGKVIYRCQHNGCAGKRWADAKAALDVPPRPGRAAGAPPDDGAPHPAETTARRPEPNSEQYPENSENGHRGGRYQEGRGNSEHSENCETGSPDDVAAAWAAPEPLTAELLPTFPTDALPLWLRAYVAALAEATQTPADLAALMSLGVLSAAAGGRVKVWVRSAWQEPVNLYVSPAQESGNRKSGVVREVTAPIREWERRREQECRPDAAAARSQRRVAEQALAHAEARAAKESDPGQRAALLTEAEQLARRLEGLPAVHTPRLLTEDCTPERLAGLLAEQGGRMAILSPEGDVFDVMAGRYSSAPNFGIFLKGHAGDPHHVDRQGRPAEYIAEPALTIAVSPQPDVLGGLADRPSFRGRGLLARFLYALPPSLLGRRSIHPEEMPDAVRSTYQMAVLALLARFQTTKPSAGEDSHHYLKPDPDAALVLDDFLAWVEPQLGPHGELAAVRDWGGKLAGTVVRIAALLHLAERPTDPAAWKARISHDVMQRAVRIGTYLIPHAQAAYDLMGLDTDTGNARLLLDWILAKRKARFTKREAHQGNKGHFKTVAELDPVLQLLEELGYLRREVWERPKGQRGQPPSPCYVVNPATLVVRAVGPSRNSQNAQNSSVPDSGGAFTEPAQNSHGIPQNSAPAWPEIGVQPAAAVVNGHARALPDKRDGFAVVVPTASGAGAAEDDTEEEDGTWTFTA